MWCIVNAETGDAILVPISLADHELPQQPFASHQSNMGIPMHRRPSRRQSRRRFLAIELLERRRLLAVDFAALNTELGTPTGVTIITHGFQTSDSGGDSLLPLATAIGTLSNGLLIDLDVADEGSDTNLTLVDFGRSGEVVVLFDWAAQSGEDSQGWPEGAGDALFSFLVGAGFVQPALSTSLPLHFIGHSFGAAVTSEAIERLASFDVVVDHVTFLDPHDFDQELFGVDSGQRQDLLGQPSGYGATRWDNVTFADSYYQTRGFGGLPFDVVPLGRPIPGAYNRFLDGADELPATNVYGILEPSGDHSYVWDTFYLGTVLGGLPAGADAPAAFTDWDNAGYRFSRVGGGTADRPEPVLYGADQDHRFSTTAIANASQSLQNTFTNFTSPPRYSPGTVFNGGFDYFAGRFFGADFVPGWSNHDGGGTGHIESVNGNNVLELDFGDVSRTHNWTYFPQNALSVQFDLFVEDQSSDDQLVFRVGDGSLLEQRYALDDAAVPDSISTTRFSGFETIRVCLSESIVDRVDSFTFAIEAVGVVDSQVQIDNVRLSASGSGCGGVNVVEIIDRSGSMSGQKLADAQTAATLFTNLMGAGDSVGVVDYGSDARVTYPLTEITANGNVQEEVAAAIAAIDSAGTTAIGLGIRLGMSELENERLGTRAMLLLSDGEENVLPNALDVIANEVPDDVRIFTIGFGTGADENLMRQIAAETGGEYYFAADGAALQRIYAELSGVVSGDQVLSSFAGNLAPGQTDRTTVFVDETADELTFGVTWPGSDIDLRFTAPDGSIVDHNLAAVDPNVRLSEGATFEFFTINAPPAGIWQVEIIAVDVDPAGEPYDFVARLDSPVRVELESLPPNAPGLNPVPIQVSIREFGPVLDATVTVTIVPTDNASIAPRHVVLYDDGAHEDGLAGDGVYGNAMLLGTEIGAYRVNVAVNGQTDTGRQFQRSLETIVNSTNLSTFSSTDLPLEINDNQTIESTITIDAPSLINDLIVEVDITHTYTGDLLLELVSPSGEVVKLADRRGGGGRDFTNTRFDDSATVTISGGAAPFTGTYRPDSPLSALNGQALNGNWRLRVSDLALGDVGTLNNWGIISNIDIPETQVDYALTIDGVALASRRIDLGVYREGTASPARRLELQNTSSDVLRLGGWSELPGISLVGSPFGEILASSGDGFEFAVQTNTPGRWTANTNLLIGTASGFADNVNWSFDAMIAPAAGSMWHNFSLPIDVDNNGTPEPIDALVIINFLNRNGSAVPVPAVDFLPVMPRFTDTNNDSLVTPIDALRVINTLNRSQFGNPEGENAVEEAERTFAFAPTSLPLFAASERTFSDFRSELATKPTDKPVASADNPRSAGDDSYQAFFSEFNLQETAVWNDSPALQLVDSMFDQLSLDVLDGRLS